MIRNKFREKKKITNGEREREPKIQTSFSYTLFKRFQITILYFDWFALNIGYENTIVMRLIHFYPLHLFGSIVKRFLFSPLIVFHHYFTMTEKIEMLAFSF